MKKLILITTLALGAAAPAMAMNAAAALEIAQDRAMSAAEANGVMVTPLIVKLDSGGWTDEILPTGCDLQVVAIAGGYTARDSVPAVQSFWTNEAAATAIGGGTVLFANMATYNGCP